VPAIRAPSHHDAASGTATAIATCPITQGRLVRLLIREGQSAQAAEAVVSALMAEPRHEFWPDDAAFDSVSLDGVIGHRQVTDAYLAHLARARGARLATFDQGLAKLYADIADLVPVHQ
jgi:predicted nucleic acid-binding protein